MGREGEVIATLLPQFERLHPDIEVRVQQLPWNAAHEKLLTAFAGGATPDLCQLGNTWIPEFAALEALEPLETSVAGSSVVRSADYFPGIWQTNVVEGRLYGVPWYVDTRLLFYRRDLLAQAGFPSPPRTWNEWRQMLAAIKARVGPDRYACCCRSTSSSPCWCWRCSSPSHCCATASASAISRVPGFVAHSSSTGEAFTQRLGAAGREYPGPQRLGGVRARLLLLLYLRSVEHRRVQAPAAARSSRRAG